ncbi:cupin domain-containing protein [Asticcacaulis solisilvae]|uniref:cupin domain-containing protein n=1 Tax=Asticcacaulis solisilvae TaxID=1217274 RepID=UPI003FD83150
MPHDQTDLIIIGELQIRYLRDSAADGTAGMFELTVPPGAKSPPPHSHDNEEIVYCLEGTLRSVCGGVVRDLNSGDSGYTPKGVVHGFSNPYDHPARVLVVNTPDVGAQYFRDVAEAVKGPAAPDPARIMAIMRHYGLTPAMPAPPSG